MARVSHRKLFCIVCKGEIPPDRILKKASTCSNEHSKILRSERRKSRDHVKCRYCNMPSTPEERQLFKQWQATQTTQKKRGRKPKPKEAPPAADPGQEEFRDYVHIP